MKDAQDLNDDPQILAREMIFDIDHPQLGAIKSFNLPIKFHGAEAGIKPSNAPMDPVLGEHNTEIYSTFLGLSQDEIAQLKDKGII